MNFYKKIASFVPKSLQEYFSKQLDFVGIELENKSFLGFIVFFGIGLSFALALDAFVLFKFPIIICFLLFLIFYFGIVWFWLYSVSESKGRFVEKILPDVLEFIASNIKAGLTVDRALLESARTEFGHFGSELKIVSKEVLTGKRLDLALLEIPKKIRSESLNKTMWLISQGIRSGGQIADLLLQLGNDLREQNTIKEDIKANVSIYVILIFFAAAVGAPLLFGVSNFIVGIMSKQIGSLSISPEQFAQYQSHSRLGNFVGIPTISISQAFVDLFSIIALIVTCIFAALTLGAINTGKEADGIKYIPILLIIAFILFFAIKAIMSIAFGAIGNVMG